MHREKAESSKPTQERLSALIFTKLNLYLLKLMSIESMPSSHLVLCHPLLREVVDDQHPSTRQPGALGRPALHGSRLHRSLSMSLVSLDPSVPEHPV